MLIKRKSMKKHMSNIHCREKELPNIVRIANALFRCTDKGGLPGTDAPKIQALPELG